jgi:hypothetical protein
MQKHLSSVISLLIFLLSLNFLSCGKEEVKNYNKYPIDLKVEQLPNGGYKFAWTSINTSDFKEYWIVRNSGDSVPFLNENNPNILENSTIIAKINNANDTEFVDTTSVFAGKTFVRVFAFLENRSLSSPNKEIKGADNVVETKGNSERIIMDRKNGVFYSFDLNSRSISIIDIFSLKVKNSTFSNLDFTKEIYLYEPENNPLVKSQLYVPEFQGSYTIISTPDLINSRFNTNLSVNAKSVAVCRDKFIVFESDVFSTDFNKFIASKDKDNFFITIINAATLQVLRSKQTFVFRWLKNQNQILALSEADSLSSLISLSIGANGIFTNDRKTLPLKLVTSNVNDVPFLITPSELFCIIGNQGQIVDATTLKSVTILSSKVKLTNGRYLDFTFSTDEKFVYALREGNLSSEKKIDVFDYATFSFVKSIPYKSKPKKIFYHDNKLKLAGESPNNANLTMFEVINP